MCLSDFLLHNFLLHGCTVKAIKKKKKQEVGADLSVCVMHLVPKVSCLESLLAIKMKMEIKIFQQSRDPMMVTRSKGHVCESLALCQHLASWGLDTYSAGGDMFFICHVKQQDRSVQISCVSMGESSYRMSPH